MSLRSLLLPLTPLYRAGLALRERRLASGREAVRRLAWPVVSVGNLSTGGAGKTPLTIRLAKALAARGWHVDVLSRGYGRSNRAAIRVRPDGTADQFGDEPLVIAREAGVPVYVAAQRYEAGLLAEADWQQSGPAVHLLDDGFQHRQLHRDVDILLLDGRDLLDRLLPTGNLREALHAASRADVIAIPEDQLAAKQHWTEVISMDRGTEEPRWPGQIWRLRRQMEVPRVDGPVLAFCGIARPEQFFAGLQGAGVRVVQKRAFPDHHRYSASDLSRLVNQARAAGAMVMMTTEKDAVRLQGRAADLPVLTAGLRTEIENERTAIEWLIGRLGAV